MTDLVPPLQPTSSRRIPLAVTAGIALATFFVGLLIAWALTQSKPAPTPTPQPVAAAPAPTKVIVTPPAATDPASLSARQEILAAQLADLEARTTAITGTAATAYGNATRAEALLVAFAARRALDRGLGLGYLEGQLKARFGASQPNEVATIIDAGRHPLTVEDLRLGLDQIGPQLALGPSGDGWLGSFGRMLGSLVVIHPKDSPSPVPSERLARIRRMLGLGQVEAAVEEVGRLPGAGQAKAWTDGAKRYIAARQALDTLESAALTGRAANPAAPAKP